MGEHGGAKQLRAAQAAATDNPLPPVHGHSPTHGPGAVGTGVPHDGHPQSGSARGMGPLTKGSGVLQGWWGLQGDQEVDREWHPAPAPRGSIPFPHGRIFQQMHRKSLALALI